jgi:hypothetical protein
MQSEMQMTIDCRDLRRRVPLRFCVDAFSSHRRLANPSRYVVTTVKTSTLSHASSLQSPVISDVCALHSFAMSLNRSRTNCKRNLWNRYRIGTLVAFSVE